MEITSVDANLQASQVYSAHNSGAEQPEGSDNEATATGLADRVDISKEAQKLAQNAGTDPADEHKNQIKEKIHAQKEEEAANDITAKVQAEHEKQLQDKLAADRQTEDPASSPESPMGYNFNVFA